MDDAISRDTIPRLHRIVEHARDQLRGIASGAATFEQCRVRYGNTQRRLAQQGLGRSTAPPPGLSGKDRYWAPTRDCLSELMRWGAVAEKSLPSARRFVDRYGGETYELTALGLQLARLSADRVQFVDEVIRRLIAAHPYLRSLLGLLDKGPVFCPAISEGDVERHRAGTAGWALWASERMGDETPPGAIEEEIATHLNRRFGHPGAGRPSSKAIAETTNDALMVAAFAARDLRLDATTIKTLQRWGTDLLIYDQSRYVPSHPGVNVIWLAADLEFTPGEDILVARRGLAKHGERVARSFLPAYQEQARLSESSLAVPYLPVHALRAQVAYECRVTRHLCDLVLSRLADGDYPGVDADVLLHIGTAALPSSEPAFRHRGRRRMEVTMRSNQ